MACRSLSLDHFRTDCRRAVREVVSEAVAFVVGEDQRSSVVGLGAFRPLRRLRIARIDALAFKNLWPQCLGGIRYQDGRRQQTASQSEIRSGPVDF
jgi:hypothetical protein